jgi:tetratricopeptide (TPR) repeat protein
VSRRVSARHNRALGVPSRYRLDVLLAVLAAFMGVYLLTMEWRQRLREESARSRQVIAAVERARSARSLATARQQELERQLEATPQDTDAWLELGQLRWSRDGPAAAAEALQAAPPAAADPRLIRMLAGAQRLMGREDLALASLDQGLRRYPANGELHAEQAMLFAMLGWFPDARLALERAVRQQADAVQLALVRATIARQQGDLHAARRALEPFLTRSPPDGEVVRQLAAVAEAEGRVQEASSLLEALVARDADADTWVALARLHLQRTDTSSLLQARTAVRRALALQPDLAPARLLMARCHRLTGDLEQAQELLERLHAERPRMTAAAFELAQVYRRLGKVDRVAPLLAQHHAGVQQRAAMRRAALAVMTHPESAASHLEMGKLCLARGLQGRAIASFERARALDPALPGLQTALAGARRLEAPPLDTEPTSASE